MESGYFRVYMQISREMVHMQTDGGKVIVFHPAKSLVWLVTAHGMWPAGGWREPHDLQER